MLWCLYYDSYSKITLKKTAIYCLAYGAVIYRNISYRNPCKVMRIVWPGACQYTALKTAIPRKMNETIHSLIFTLIWVKSKRSNEGLPSLSARALLRRWAHLLSGVTTLDVFHKQVICFASSYP